MKAVVINKVWVSGIVLLLFAFSLSFTRQVSGINLLLFSFVGFFYLLSSIKTQRIERSLLILSIVSLFYAYLSVLGVLPGAWTRYRVVSSIPQQALFSYAFLPAFCLMVFYFKNVIGTKEGRVNAAIILFLIWLYIKLIALVIGAGFIEDHDIPLVTWFFGIHQLGNHSAMIIVAASLYLSTLTGRAERLPVIFAFCAMSAVSLFSQNKVYAIAFFFFWVFARYAYLLLVVFILISVLFYAAFIFDPLSVQFIDVNMAVRLVLIRDAISGFFATYTIGVGFGTESLSNYYPELVDRDFFSEDKEGFIHTSVHNSYATIAFRVGLLGIASFLMFLLAGIKRVKFSQSDSERAFKSSMLFAFFVVTFQNPAMESFAYMYGACLYMSLIWAFDEAKNCWPSNVNAAAASLSSPR